MARALRSLRRGARRSTSTSRGSSVTRAFARASRCRLSWSWALSSAETRSSAPRPPRACARDRPTLRGRACAPDGGEVTPAVPWSLAFLGGTPARCVQSVPRVSRQSKRTEWRRRRGLHRMCLLAKFLLSAEACVNILRCAPRNLICPTCLDRNRYHLAELLQI